VVASGIIGAMVQLPAGTAVVAETREVSAEV